MFLLEDSGGEAIHRIAIHYRHSALHNYWTTVERLIDKVDRAATHFNAMFECLSLSIESGK